MTRRRRGVSAMFYTTVALDALATAATDVQGIGFALTEANAAAAPATTGVLAAGADEVSAAIASLFSGQALTYQTLSAQAAKFHAQFVQTLSWAGNSYAATEAANASPLASVGQDLQSAIQTVL